MSSQWQHLRSLGHRRKPGTSSSSLKVVVSYVDCLVVNCSSSSSSSSKTSRSESRSVTRSHCNNSIFLCIPTCVEVLLLYFCAVYIYHIESYTVSYLENIHVILHILGFQVLVVGIVVVVVVPSK